jgi:hypothetical protein
MKCCKQWTTRLMVTAPMLLFGCQRLHYQTNFKFNAGDVESFSVTAPQREQEITVTVSSTGSAVDAYLVLDKDQPAAESALQSDKKPSAFLSRGSGEAITLTGTIPAKTSFSILVSGATKPSKVQVKVAGH